MTFAEKLGWLETATAEELINQMKWTVTALSHGSIDQQVEAQQDYELVTAELLKRLNA